MLPMDLASRPAFRAATGERRRRRPGSAMLTEGRSTERGGSDRGSTDRGRSEHEGGGRVTPQQLLEYCLAKPGAWQDEPWEGSVVAKAGSLPDRRRPPAQARAARAG